MSLNFNSEKCSVPLPYTDRELNERQSLVFASMAVGLSKITPNNVREWLVRVVAWGEIFGGDLVGPGALGTIEQWIGLETNVDDEDREAWRLRLTSLAIEKGEIAADEYLGVVA